LINLTLSVYQENSTWQFYAEWRLDRIWCWAEPTKRFFILTCSKIIVWYTVRVMIYQEKIKLATKGFADIHDITGRK